MACPTISISPCPQLTDLFRDKLLALLPLAPRGIGVPTRVPLIRAGSLLKLEQNCSIIEP
jgi:hypothetical protein